MAIGCVPLEGMTILKSVSVTLLVSAGIGPVLLGNPLD